MDTSNANSPEYLRQAIDAEIKSLEDSIRESVRALKQRRNALAPISSLPTEIIAAIFFRVREKRDQHLAWIRVTHVCHQWREIVINDPLLWSYINFYDVTLASATEMLSRAKNVPLHLEARVSTGDWDDARFSAFDKVLQACVFHTRHLSIEAEDVYLRRTLEGLTLPARSLEYLSLSREEYWVRTVRERPFVPDTLFDGTAPKLFSLKLHGCDISWKSPLLKGLRHLDIRTPPEGAVPSLVDWLDTLDEMPQLKTLVLHSASPTASYNIARTSTLPSLTHLDISDSAEDCAPALSHLVLPALTSLRLTAVAHHPTGDDVENILPYVTQYSHGSQDTQPLQSVLICGTEMSALIFGWPMPDISIKSHDPLAWQYVSSARIMLSIVGDRLAYSQLPHHILDAAMEALPLDNLVTLTAQHRTGLDVRFWLHHAPRWPLLRCVRLAWHAARVFCDTVLEDGGRRECPFLPSLTKLDLVDHTTLNERRTLHLCDALMERVEQGVPLETLDLRACRGTSYAVRLLSEIVVDVWGPETLIDNWGRFIEDGL